MRCSDVTLKASISAKTASYTGNSYAKVSIQGLKEFVRRIVDDRLTLSGGKDLFKNAS